MFYFYLDCKNTLYLSLIKTQVPSMLEFVFGCHVQYCVKIPKYKSHLPYAFNMFWYSFVIVYKD